MVKTRLIQLVVLVCVLAGLSMAAFEAALAGPLAQQDTPVLVARKVYALHDDADDNYVPSPGDTLAYTITIANNGLAPASGVTFSDTLDANTSLLPGSAWASAGALSVGANAVFVDIGILPAGTSVVVSFHAAIKDPLPANVTQVANWGEVSCSELGILRTDDPNTALLVGDPTVTQVTAAPVLVATKSAELIGAGQANPGETLLYVVAITNTGSADAAGLWFSDEPDANTFLEAGYFRASPGITVVSGNRAGDTAVNVDIGTLAGRGGHVEIKFAATITNPLPANVTGVRNQGVVTSSVQPLVKLTDDPATGEVGDQTVTPVVASAVLGATKKYRLHTDADHNGRPSAGDTLAYTIIISNTGNQGLSGVVFDDTPGDHTTLVPGSVTATRGIVRLGNEPGHTAVRLDVGELPGGSAVESVFRVTIAKPLPANVTQVTNQGVVSSDQKTQPTDDPTAVGGDNPTVVPVTPMQAVLRAKSDDPPIDFYTNNSSESGEHKSLPHLVLYENGSLNPNIDRRTLLVTVDNVEVPPEGVTVTLKVETQHGNPDQGGDVNRAPFIPIWHESKLLFYSAGRFQSVTFEREFGAKVLSGTQWIDTPTDYFYYAIYTTDPNTPAIKDDYAFLMESQWTQPLPIVPGDTMSAAPRELILYYCDMFPYGRASGDLSTWKTRAQVPGYVHGELASAMATAFYTQSVDWGLDPWHAAWRSGRGEERLSVALNDGKTWYHGEAGDWSNISLITIDNGWSHYYPTLLDSQMAVFHHELFHNVQLNYTWHYGGRSWGTWEFVFEGTAVLATAEGQPNLQFDPNDYLTGRERQYISFSNGFLKDYLNQSYASLNQGLNGYKAAIYWRFLRDRCGGMGVAGRAMEAYSRQVGGTDSPNAIVTGMSSMMAPVLAGCPFKTFAESLAAFARANYTLRLEGGRCGVQGVGAWCQYEDPNPQGLYIEPPLDPPSPLNYTGGAMTHTGYISTSFGMDFIEIGLAPQVNRRPLTVTFHSNPAGPAEFNVQLWKLKKGTGAKPAPATDAPETLTQKDGNGDYIYVFPTLDVGGYDRLALIVTRLDPNEAAPNNDGKYVVTLRGPIPPSKVSVVGPTAGEPGTSYAFTATVGPVTATQPFTYTWQVAGHSPQVHPAGDLDDIAQFAWDTTGPQVITVTAANSAGTVTGTHTITLTTPVPPAGVTISGATRGDTNVTYRFEAIVSPVSTTIPLCET